MLRCVILPRGDESLVRYVTDLYESGGRLQDTRQGYEQDVWPSNFVPFVIRLIPTRRAAFYCVGELMAVFGAQVGEATAWTVAMSKGLQLVYVLHG